MCPELFKIGPLTVYSYGLMLGIAFIVGSYVLTLEFKRKGIHPELASEVTIFALISGIIGAKIFHLFDVWDAFLQDPIGEAFSPGGLVWYGGFLAGLIVIYLNSRRRNLPFLVLVDSLAPAAALGYGIGRIGCHLSGDGDYGIPTDLPWGTNYSKGTYPPSYAFRGTEIAKNYPDGIVPDNTPLHPTPIYEFLMGVIIFLILWNMRKKTNVNGKIFMWFLILHGSARFLVEFIRINPKILFGLTEAQLISVILVSAGIVGIFYLKKNPDLVQFDPKQIKYEPKKKK
jgi:phosphatidylglycerol:prolipoprotein diacylglycerol transferase